MRYKATILSAVHVGDGGGLTPAEFFTTRDAVVAFDFHRWLTAKPERAEGLDAALAKLGDNVTLSALLTAEEQAAADLRRYALPAAEFVRRRLAGEAPGAGGSAAPATTAPAVAVPKPAPARVRTDLRGGLGGRIKLDLPNLPPGPTLPEPAVRGPLGKTAAAIKPAPRPIPLPPPSRPEPERPPERFVSTFVKTAGDGAYLPGSTIKGALRTALLVYLSAEYPPLREGLAAALAAGLNDHLYGPRQADEDVALLLAPDGGRRRFDYLAGLSVSDSEPQPADKVLAVEMIRTLSPRTDRDGNPVSSRPAGRPVFRDRGPPRGGLGDRRGAPKLEAGSTDFKGAPVFVEAARAKAQFFGRAVLDESLVLRRLPMPGRPAHLPPLTPDLLCKAANALAARVLAREMQYFAGLAGDCDRVLAFYRELSNRLSRAGERTCLVSLGFGAGWHRIGFGAALVDMPAIDPIDFRVKFRLAAHRLRSRFPKTRRLAMETFAVPRCPPGWVELEWNDER